MPKYVGRHRAPTTWTPWKTLTLAGSAGIIALIYTPVQVGQSAVSADLSVVASPTYTVDPTPTTIPTPDPKGDGMKELEEWLDAGGPGYIPNTPAKGVGGPSLDESVEPLITVVQATCERGPASALGLSPNATRVYETICALFPEVTAFGGARWGDSGDHGTGNAIDAMIDPYNGDLLAQWLIDHWGELPLKYVIWEQRIWQGNGWQWMEDRGSPTANHYDHVHVSVY